MLSTDAKLKALQNYCALHSLSLRGELVAGGYVVYKQSPFVSSVWLDFNASLEGWLKALEAGFHE